MDFKEIVCKTDEDYWNKMYKYISKKRMTFSTYNVFNIDYDDDDIV